MAGPLSIRQRNAINAAYMSGVSQATIVRQLKVSQSAVTRQVAEYKRDCAAIADIDLHTDIQNWRSKLRRMAIESLVLALNPKNPKYEVYKAAAIATDALKGLGEYGAVAPAGGIQVQIVIPQGLKLPEGASASVLINRKHIDISTLPQEPTNQEPKQIEQDAGETGV